MTDKEFDEMCKRDIKMLVDTAYDKACDDIVAAIGLVHVPSMTKEHIVQLIRIVQRVAKSQ